MGQNILDYAVKFISDNLTVPAITIADICSVTQINMTDLQVSRNGSQDRCTVYDFALSRKNSVTNFRKYIKTIVK